MPRDIQSTVDPREQRFIPSASAIVSIRASADNAPVIEGYGALFNEETVITGYFGSFRERIAPGAFAETIEKDDIRVSFNHSANAILGRTSAKTATVGEDGKGLKYTAIPPDTSAGRDTVVSIKRGDVTGSSFQFEIQSSDDEEWDDSETKLGKLPLRTIKRAKLWEVGPVAFPAYEKTTVSARAIGKIEEARAVTDAAAATTPVPAGSTRTADDLKRDIQRDLGLLLDLMTERTAPEQAAQTPAPATEPETPVAAVEAAAPVARAADAPAEDAFEMSVLERELAQLEAECR